MEGIDRATRANALTLLKKKLQHRHDRSGHSESAVAQQAEARVIEPAVYSPEVEEGCDVPPTSHDDVVVPALNSGIDSLVIKQPQKKPSTAPPPPLRQLHKSFKKLVVTWSCTKCQRECIPVREESRCLCGHRYKEHPSTADDPRVGKATGVFKPFACTAAKCPCVAFYYIVAEGAWILRCRCKHKHIDHDPGASPFRCKKPKCTCDGFGSPWVCNCNHAWGDHVQATVEKEFKPLDLLHAQFTIEELNRVDRTNLLAEPLNL